MYVENFEALVWIWLLTRNSFQPGEDEGKDDKEEEKTSIPKEPLLALMNVSGIN